VRLVRCRGESISTDLDGASMFEFCILKSPASRTLMRREGWRRDDSGAIQCVFLIGLQNPLNSQVGSTSRRGAALGISNILTIPAY